jgi:hypothetical protein
VVGGKVDVGVGQHDGVVLGAAKRLHPLAITGSALVDVAGDRRRPYEGNSRNVRRVEDRVDRFLVTMDDIEDAIR